MESFQTADGRTLAYRLTGSGPTLVCHPGGPGFSSRYFGDLAGLGSRFTLAMLNPRGTEGSDRPAGPRAYATDDYVADLEEFRAHLGLDRMLLLGHSHGGVVAQAYAAKHRERVERLVLASTIARFHAEQQGAMEAAMHLRSDEPWFEDGMAALEQEQAGDWSSDEELAGIVLRELPFYFATYGDAEREFVVHMGKDVICGAALKAFNDDVFTSFDMRPRLPAITAPTLVIAGTEDFITGPACAQELAVHLGDARLVLLEGVGHMIFVEAPDEVRAAVADFLTS
jgi:pimeloyl-ACP methyl ester carboxylesterase